MYICMYQRTISLFQIEEKGRWILLKSVYMMYLCGVKKDLIT